MSEPLCRRALTRSPLGLTALGCGTAPLGNLYRAISDATAEETIAAALAAGVRYFDTAPYYGFGLSERRLGSALLGVRDVVISSKVGRLLRPLSHEHATTARHGFASALPFEPVFDYRYDAVMRSWQESRRRLGVERIDILLVHDIGARTHGDRHAETFAQLMHGGGLRALQELRDCGAIAAIGIGVNEWEIALEIVNTAAIDIVLLAGRYTLLEQSAVTTFLPACDRLGVSVAVGGPFNSGILATGSRAPSSELRYDYGPVPGTVLERVRAIEATCSRHGVSLQAAALQFPLAHPAVVSVVPGVDSAARVAETAAAMRAPIPADFWLDLRASGLLHRDAPLPAGFSI
jgi:D-threo-aldose 1-dehydrogenase